MTPEQLLTFFNFANLQIAGIAKNIGATSYTVAGFVLRPQIEGDMDSIDEAATDGWVFVSYGTFDDDSMASTASSEIIFMLSAETHTDACAELAALLNQKEG